jgi:hypothetical protein
MRTLLTKFLYTTVYFGKYCYADGKGLFFYQNINVKNNNVKRTNLKNFYQCIKYNDLE